MRIRTPLILVALLAFATAARDARADRQPVSGATRKARTGG